MLVETLITKAAKCAGSQKALAEMLGVSETVVSGWKSGKRKMQPDDIAAVAHIAGYNATNFLALATLSQAKGTPKEKVLQEALGESIRQLESTLLSGSRANSREIQWEIMYTVSNVLRLLIRKYKLHGGFLRAKIGLLPMG